MFNIHTVNFTNLDLSALQSDELAHLYLNKAELARYANYNSVINQQQFLLSRVVIKKLYLNSDEVLNQFELMFDKQRQCLTLLLTNGECLFISLSHSDSYIAFTVSNHYSVIGIDIEIPKRKRDIKNIAIEYFAQSESRDMTEDKFYRLWTLKEATAKATQQGLADIIGIDVEQLIADKSLICYCDINDSYYLSYVADKALFERNGNVLVKPVNHWLSISANDIVIHN